MWHNPDAQDFTQDFAQEFSQDFAKDFSGALLNSALPKPQGVVGPDGKAAEKRFNVYRNNVAYSLIEALGKNYPAVKAQCGEARFNDAARLYLSQHPPRGKIMFELGLGFAEWLDGFAPATAQMPWLADLARLERAFLAAYHAGDTPPLDPAVMATIAPEAFAELRFIKHSAAVLMASSYSIFTLLEAGRNGAVVPEPLEAQTVLVTRPRLEVEVRALPKDVSQFMSEILQGASLAEAAAAGFQTNPEFDLSACLGGLLQSGAMAGLKQ